MIRLAAFDLDNTLFGPDLTFSPRVRAAIARALDLGVVVTLATGRGPSPTDKFAEQLNISAPLVCFQGGVVYDYQAKVILHDVRLPPATIPAITRLAQARGWHLHFETPFMIYLPRESGHPNALFDLLKHSAWTRVDDLTRDLPETPHKFILTVHDRAERDTLAAELRALCEADPVLSALSVVSSHPILVEGLPRGLNKSVGLAWLAEYLGLAREDVLAVGDNDNDVEMLQWAAVGVAMGNSSPAALAAADWVAPDVSHDGAAIALEKYL